MTELELHRETSLSLDSGAYWNDTQLAALRHMGVENASEGDLTVFHHVCTKTGLDPFARQIYMIGRNSQDQRTKQWVTKYTIQTGIDGFRLIGRRAADRAHQTISMSAPEWAHEDGSWRSVWRTAWGMPIGARVTIQRGGEPFVAVALFDEYKQTKSGGNLTHMWSQRPAGQIAKCAEALAWRMAFPQDLSGIYADEEMGQADRSEPREVTATGTAAERMAAVLAPPTSDPELAQPNDSTPPGEPSDSGSEPVMVTSAQLKKIGATMRDLGITERDNALVYVGDVIGRPVVSRNELSRDEAGRVIDSLERDLAQPFDAQVEAGRR